MGRPRFRLGVLVLVTKREGTGFVELDLFVVTFDDSVCASVGTQNEIAQQLGLGPIVTRRLFTTKIKSTLLIIQELFLLMVNVQGLPMQFD